MLAWLARICASVCLPLNATSRKGMSPCRVWTSLPTVDSLARSFAAFPSSPSPSRPPSLPLPLPLDPLSRLPPSIASRSPPLPSALAPSPFPPPPPPHPVHFHCCAHLTVHTAHTSTPLLLSWTHTHTPLLPFPSATERVGAPCSTTLPSLELHPDPAVPVVARLPRLVSASRVEPYRTALLPQIKSVGSEQPGQ